MDKIILNFTNTFGIEAQHEVEGDGLYPIYKLLEELLWRLTEKGGAEKEK